VPVKITITFDLEDSRRSHAQDERFVSMCHRLLDFLEEQDVRATVFVVGEIGLSHPELVRRVAAAGHEIGLHGLRHRSLGEIGRERLPAELREGRDVLQHVSQSPVNGFRAPIFSLTPATGWAVHQLTEAGFAYSSSVLPAANPLHGWPGAPCRPFRWTDGLIELPCPVFGAGRLQVPFLGGAYLRYLPLSLVECRLRRMGMDHETAPWSYVHPYDLDPDEPFFVLPHANWLTSRILHARRSVTLDRLQALIDFDQGAGPPLGELAGQLQDPELPRVSSA
jgi:peptidoglycan-N-acetylglucosamine deacetylase